MEIQNETIAIPTEQQLDTAVAQRSTVYLSLPLKLAYALGGIGNSMKTYAIGLFLLFFYTSVLGLPGTWVGLATAIGLIWDAVVDPLIGSFSDRARLRFGRRHSFMLLGAICMGISFAAIFSPPMGLSAPMLLVWLLGSSLLMRTTNSLFNVPYFALGAELSHDYHERTSISGLRAALALGGTLVAAAMSFALFFPNTDPGVDPKFNVAGYQIMGLTFGALMMISGLLATFGTLSYRHKLAPATRSIKQSPGVYRSILLAFRNPSFLMLIISIALFFLASVVNATTAIHYLTYYAQLTTSQALSLFQLSFFVGAVSGIPAWLWIGRRVDKHWIYFWATVALALVMAAAYFLIGEQRLFGVGNLAVLVGGNFVAGLFAGAIWTMPASMIADIADQDEVMTGQRREGVFFGVFSFAQQMAASVAVLLTGILLDHYVGLVPGQLEQSPTTIDRIAIVFGPFAGTLLLVAAFFVLGYRLNQRRVREIQSALAQSHGAVPYDPTD